MTRITFNSIFILYKETKIMNYSPKQIENAKRAYNAMLQYRSVQSYNPEIVGWNTAEQRAEYHNNIVSQILGGNKEVAREWKLFFLKEEVLATQKSDDRKDKLAANKAASSDVLLSVKAAGKKLADYYAFVKADRKFAREFYSKKFTTLSVNAFLSL